MQNKLQDFTMTVPRVRSRKGKVLNTANIISSGNDREEIIERRLPGDDLYLPHDVN